MNLLVLSIVASVVLTVVLNVAIRALPGVGRRIGEWIEQATTSSPDEEGRRVRVIVPWRAMIVGSIALTVVLNLLLRVV